MAKAGNGQDHQHGQGYGRFPHHCREDEAEFGWWDLEKGWGKLDQNKVEAIIGESQDLPVPLILHLRWTSQESVRSYDNGFLNKPYWQNPQSQTSVFRSLMSSRRDLYPKVPLILHLRWTSQESVRSYDNGFVNMPYWQNPQSQTSVFRSLMSSRRDLYPKNKFPCKTRMGPMTSYCMELQQQTPEGRETRLQQATEEPRLPGAQVADLCTATLTLGCWLKKNEQLGMIQCSQCHSWYHHKCIPMHWRVGRPPLCLLCRRPHPRAEDCTKYNVSILQQLCDDSGCSAEELPKAMEDREGWGKRGMAIRATSTPG
uniref:Uncharacterized protein n=1 Tax=Branchiostoma floridae TaxID=7739 RepID=C3ZUR3_BRAFL|eukprot:XP_002587764.1 hypothetical protein BRAFLDRAFT_94668 [Branchiostoma floridae]